MGFIGVMAVPSVAALGGAAWCWWDLWPHVAWGRRPLVGVLAWLALAGSLGAAGPCWLAWRWRRWGRGLRPALACAGCAGLAFAAPLAIWGVEVHAALTGASKPALWPRGGATLAPLVLAGSVVAVLGLVGLASLAWLALRGRALRRVPPADVPAESRAGPFRLSLLGAVVLLAALVLAVPDTFWDPAPVEGGARVLAGRTTRAWVEDLRSLSRRDAAVEALVATGGEAVPVFAALLACPARPGTTRRLWALHRLDDVLGPLGIVPWLGLHERDHHEALDDREAWARTALVSLRRLATREPGALAALVDAWHAKVPGAHALVPDALAEHGSAGRRALAESLEPPGGRLAPHELSSAANAYPELRPVIVRALERTLTIAARRDRDRVLMVLRQLRAGDGAVLRPLLASSDRSDVSGALGCYLALPQITTADRRAIADVAMRWDGRAEVIDRGRRFTYTIDVAADARHVLLRHALHEAPARSQLVRLLQSADREERRDGQEILGSLGPEARDWCDELMAGALASGMQPLSVLQRLACIGGPAAEARARVLLFGPLQRARGILPRLIGTEWAAIDRDGAGRLAEALCASGPPASTDGLRMAVALGLASDTVRKAAVAACLCGDREERLVGVWALQVGARQAGGPLVTLQVLAEDPDARVALAARIALAIAADDPAPVVPLARARLAACSVSWEVDALARECLAFPVLARALLPDFRRVACRGGQQYLDPWMWLGPMEGRPPCRWANGWLDRRPITSCHGG